MNPSTSYLTVLWTLSFQECAALSLSVGQSRLKNSKEDFLNTLSLSEGCISDHIL